MDSLTRWLMSCRYMLTSKLMVVLISGTHHSMVSVNFTGDCMVKLVLEFVADQRAIQEMLETLHNTGK